jgi:hypothetical protein
MNTPSQRQVPTYSFGERVVLAAILALIALIPRLAALRTGHAPFVPDPSPIPDARSRIGRDVSTRHA